MNKEEKEFFYSIGRGSLNLNGKFYYGLDYSITDFMNSLEQENKKQKEVIDKLKEWIKEYIETNEKWYSSELSNHDKEYYKKDYIDSKFWLMKFQNQMQEIEVSE